MKKQYNLFLSMFGLIVLVLIFYLFNSSFCTKSKRDNIVFYKPYTDKCEGGTYPKSENEYLKQYKIVKNADPKIALKKALEKKDYRFIGVSGQAYIVPGLKNEECEKLTKKYGFKIIAGTSDAINFQRPDLNSVAYEFAEKYNNELLKRIKK